MKKSISLLLLLVFLAMPLASSAYEEESLPEEAAPKAAVEREEIGSVFTGYVNSKDVTMVADVLGAVYNLCSSVEESFCSDEQAVLIIGGDDTGPVVKVVKRLDEAIDNMRKVHVMLSKDPYFGGARKIVDVKIVN